MTFSEIERFLDPSCAVVREDKGGYIQPQLWRKYGKGTVSPTGNGRRSPEKQTAVELAENLIPGTAALYNAVLWDILRTPKISATEGKFFCQKLDAQVAETLMSNSIAANSLWQAVLKLEAGAMHVLEDNPHIDTLSIFLLHLKCAHWTRHLEVARTVLYWNSKTQATDQAYAAIEPRLLPFLKAYESKLSLTQRDEIKRRLAPPVLAQVARIKRSLSSTT